MCAYYNHRRVRTRIFTTLLFKQNGCYQLLLHFLTIFHSNPASQLLLAAILCITFLSDSRPRQPTRAATRHGARSAPFTLTGPATSQRQNRAFCTEITLSGHVRLILVYSTLTTYTSDSESKERPGPHDMHAHTVNMQHAMPAHSVRQTRGPLQNGVLEIGSYRTRPGRQASTRK